MKLINIKDNSSEEVLSKLKHYAEQEIILFKASEEQDYIFWIIENSNLKEISLNELSKLMKISTDQIKLSTAAMIMYDMNEFSID
ncbi:hypothetical protein AB5V95_01420 [Metamycoplasma spumans]|uniref:hypothetical protein n=1 Tax=Metamycoplasma spumans TaxID=92406 RepID=UPI0034DD5A40